MGEIVNSDLTGKEYDIKNTVRILNIQQICAYLKMGIKPLDLYASIDFKTNKPVLVALFDKKETAEAYVRWKNSENLWEELNNEQN